MTENTNSNNDDIYRRGNIVWIDFQDRGGSVQKGKRQALILSNNLNNKYSPVLQVLPITTSPKDFFLHIKRDNTRICVEQLTSVSKEDVLVNSYIEHASEEEMKLVEDYVNIQLGFKNKSEVFGQ